MMTAEKFQFEKNSVLALAEGERPEWLRVLPLGEVRGRDGRVFIVDDIAWQALLANFLAAKTAGVPVAVDENHASHREGSAPALGYAANLEMRDDGVYARIAWTALGEETLAAGTYGAISPVFFVMVDQTGARPSELLSIGLTNIPNLALPLSPETSQRILELNHAANPQEQETHMEKSTASADINAVRFALGLDPSTTVPEVVATARELRNSLADERRARAEERAEMLVNSAVAAGRVAPAARNHLKIFAIADFAAARAFVDALRDGSEVPLRPLGVPGDINANSARDAEDERVREALGFTQRRAR